MTPYGQCNFEGMPPASISLQGDGFLALPSYYFHSLHKVRFKQESVSDGWWQIMRKIHYSSKSSQPSVVSSSIDKYNLLYEASRKGWPPRFSTSLISNCGFSSFNRGSQLFINSLQKSWQHWCDQTFLKKICDERRVMHLKLT